MNRLFIPLTTLLLSHGAAADSIARPTAAEEAEVDPSPIPLPDFDVLRPRQGLHIGFTAGGAYIPNVGASAVMASLDFNIGWLRLDHRVSPTLYYSTQSNERTMGSGLAFQEGFHFNSRYSISFGSMITLHHGEFNDGNSYTTLGLGLTASPATVRLGAKRNMEISLNVLLLREFEYDTANAGGFFAFSFLSL